MDSFVPAGSAGGQGGAGSGDESVDSSGLFVLCDWLLGLVRIVNGVGIGRGWTMGHYMRLEDELGVLRLLIRGEALRRTLAALIFCNRLNSLRLCLITVSKVEGVVGV